MNIDFSTSGNVAPKEDAKIENVLSNIDRDSVEVGTSQLDLASIKTGQEVSFSVSDNIAPKQ